MKTQNEIILEFLPYIRTVAYSIYKRMPASSSIFYTDLVQIGVLGLIDAIKKFKPEKKVDLKVYAIRRIRGEMLDSLRRLSQGIRVLQKNAKKIEWVYLKFYGEKGRAPTDEELKTVVAAEKNLKGKQYAAAFPRIFLSNYVMDLIPPAKEYFSRADASPFILLQKIELKELLIDLLHTLPPRNREIMRLYYFGQLKQLEISKCMELNPSRVSQILSQGLKQLRRAARKRKVNTKDFYEDNKVLRAAGHGEDADFNGCL